MRAQRVAGAALVVATLSVAAGCGSSKSTSGTGGSTATGENVALGAFKVQIQSVTMPAAAGGQPVVTFRVTESDQPVDDLAQRIKNGSTNPATFPWASTPRFTLAALQASGDYKSYYTTQATGAPWAVPNLVDPASPTTVPNVLPSATQATFKAPTAANPDIQGQGNGVYTWTMPALPADATIDPTATHTAGVWMTHHPSADADPEPSTSTFNFVPNGSAAQKLETVITDACNRCHGPSLEAHDTRLGTQVCLTCHSPQTTDPETGNSVNFKSFIHKIHLGGELPSARGTTGKPFTIVGFQAPGAPRVTATHQYNDTFINDVRNCTLCHQGANADNWKNNASFAACTSCHDNVNLDPTTPVGTTCQLGHFDTLKCDHPSLAAGNGAGVVNSTVDCRQCHTATAPAIGVVAVHVTLADQAKAFRYDIMNVAVDPATRIPTVTFAVRRPDNSTYDLQTSPEYTRTNASLTAMFAWPSQEFTNEGSNGGPGQPVRVSIVSGTPPALGSAVAPVAGQPGVYTVTGPAIPDATKTPVTAAKLGGAPTSAYVHLEGHPVSATGQQLPVKFAWKTYPIGAGQTVQDRRVVVDVARCDQCHGYLSAHGRNRNDDTNACVSCHNPRATDVGQRQSTAATTAAACRPGTTEQSIDFKRLVHEIHSADIRLDPVTICGFGGNPSTFPGAAGIPHGVQNCNLCHVNDSWNVPAPTSPIPLDTVVDTKGTPTDQTDDVTLPRVRAVCTSCHDQVSFAVADLSLPMCSTLAGGPNSAPCRHSAGPQADDANCAGCHAKGQLAAIDVVHGFAQGTSLIAR